jgi:hypothetical protein
MSRTFWFAAGAGAGLYAMNRARRVREAFTADGLRDRARGVAHGARLLREEFAQGRIEKETELRERLGLVPHGRHELTAPAPHVRSGLPSPTTSPTTEEKKH